MTLRAQIFGGMGTLTLDAPYDGRGPIVMTGPPSLLDEFSDWLHIATGFQGHRVGYPVASPRDLHFALEQYAAQWRVSAIECDDASPLGPPPDGAVY
jgi:hypothetical protein